MKKYSDILRFINRSISQAYPFQRYKELSNNLADQYIKQND